MRAMLLSTLLLGSLAAMAPADEFPYVAYVNSSDVYVRSGPGRDYYPTDKLQKGDRVEVYRHDPGGWYAIRPPRNSYSWVSKRHLDPLPDGLAVVNTPRAVARVGSAFSDVRDVIQVRLDEGERVELSGHNLAESPWCKIAPPAGEFRWVFSKYVERELPSDLAADAREAQAARAFAGTAAGFVDHPGASDGAGGDAVDLNAMALEQEMNRIDLELSAMVAGDIANWDLSVLKQRAEKALGHANSAVERGQARVLLTQVTRFEEIKQRHEQLRAAPKETADPRAPLTPGGRQVDISRFDGVGRLSPVISEKPGSPQFALVDQSNGVVSFISPAPGVNLRPYVDHYVGVNGQRGYLTDLGRQHINVQRITMLEEVRR